MAAARPKSAARESPGTSALSVGFAHAEASTTGPVTDRSRFYSRNTISTSTSI